MKAQTYVKTGLVALLAVLAVLTMTASAGDYYIYADFSTSNSDFLGGYGPDGWYDSANDQQLLFVDRPGGYFDVYEVSIPSGGDPNTHPANPNNTGPVEPRTLDLLSSYKFTDDGVSQRLAADVLYVDDTGIYYGANYGVNKWDHNWNYQGKVVTVGTAGSVGYTQSMAYDAATSTWYAGTASRMIYSFQQGVDTTWQYEFTHPTYAGSHHDGMEFVNGYLWISDMTSDVIAQWQKSGGTWTEVEQFTYSYPGVVEGMGFGPFSPPIDAGHFWATSGNNLYELGGGGISQALQPDLVAVEYELVDYTLVDNIFEESLRVKFENRGTGDASNVGATITSGPPNTDFTDDASDPNDDNCDPTITVGAIPAGGSAWSTDTFTIRVDLTYTPAPDPCDEVFWDVEYDDSLGTHYLLQDVPEFPPGEGPNCCP